MAYAIEIVFWCVVAFAIVVTVGRPRCRCGRLDGRLWVVGVLTPGADDSWEIVGVFDSPGRADAECTSPMHFVGPVRVNWAEHRPAVEWRGAWFPMGQNPLGDATTGGGRAVKL